MDKLSFEINRIRRTDAYSMPKKHWHNTCEIYYMRAGERYYFIKDRVFHVRKGDLVFIAESVLHRTSVCGQAEHERVLINFDRNLIAPYAADEPQLIEAPFGEESCLVRLSPREQIAAEQLLEQMLEERSEPRWADGIMLQSLLVQLLALAVRAMRASGAPSSVYVSPRHRKISEVVDYINRHYAEPLRLDQLADRFYVSPFHLSRMFKETTGFTFIEYLNHVRVKEAQGLLRRSKDRVLTIAGRVGFDSISHFGRVFKQLTGITPLQYRKNG